MKTLLLIAALILLPFLLNGQIIANDSIVIKQTGQYNALFYNGDSVHFEMVPEYNKIPIEYKDSLTAPGLIIYNDLHICFDTTAARIEYEKSLLKDRIITTQDSIITSKDSLILVLSLQKDTLLNENKTIVKLYNDKNDQVNELAFKLVQSRKEAKIWFRAFKIGTAVLFGVLVLR